MQITAARIRHHWRRTENPIFPKFPVGIQENELGVCCHSCRLPSYSMAYCTVPLCFDAARSFWHSCVSYFPSCVTLCSLSLPLPVKEPSPIPLEDIFHFMEDCSLRQLLCPTVSLESRGKGKVCLPPLDHLSSSVLDLLPLICIALPSNYLHLLFCVNTLGEIIPESRLFGKGIAGSAGTRPPFSAPQTVNKMAVFLSF